MSDLPANTVYEDGQGQVSAANLNTFLQSAGVAANLRQFVGITGMAVFMLGQTAADDGLQGFFYWNANATAVDDNGLTTVVPSGSAQGAWIRLTGGTAGYGYTPTVASPSPFGSFMAGMNTTFSTRSSPGVLVVVSGSVANGTDALSQLSLRYGSGSPPVAGAAPAGAQVTAVTGMTFANAGGGGQVLPFALTTVIAGLAVGTTYWVDILATQGTSGPAMSISSLTVSIVEL